MVGAQVTITPPVRGAASGATGGSAVNQRERRGQPAVVAGVKVPAVAERPPVVPVGVGRPLAVPADDFWCQQVIPHEIFIQLRILVFSVAARLVIIRLGGASRGRVPFLKAGFPWRDRDGDGLACLPAEPAPFPAEVARDTRCVTCRVELHASRVGHLGPLAVALIIPPPRLPNILRLRKAERVSVKVFIFAFKPFRVVSLLSRHGGLQVDHLEFLLRQSLLEPLQVAFTYLQLRLDVLYGVQVHLGYFSVGEFIPPVFCKFLLFPHIDVQTGLSVNRRLVTQQSQRVLELTLTVNCVFTDR